MRKQNFCVFANTLRDYGSWERKLYECGIDLEGRPVAHMAENMWAAMCEFDPSFSYDEKLGFDWIIEWTCNETPYVSIHRHGREFDLTSASALYDFLVFMNEHGWEDE